MGRNISYLFQDIIEAFARRYWVIPRVVYVRDETGNGHSRVRSFLRSVKQSHGLLSTARQLPGISRRDAKRHSSRSCTMAGCGNLNLPGGRYGSCITSCRLHERVSCAHLTYAHTGARRTHRTSRNILTEWRYTHTLERVARIGRVGIFLLSDGIRTLERVARIGRVGIFLLSNHTAWYFRLCADGIHSLKAADKQATWAVKKKKKMKKKRKKKKQKKK
jgi:hypothetical protein